MRPDYRARSLPRPVQEIPVEVCRGLHWLFTDIDVTLTTDGLIPPDAFGALWELFRDGVRVVPVTGRPAGWCDHIARMWPVAGVVGENGAFSFAYDRQRRVMKRRYASSEEERAAGRRKLEEVRRRVLEEVPGAGVSADQPYRISDLAIDFREDVAPLSRDEVRRICEIAREEGAVCKVSSIHVNCWYGRFDKIAGVSRFLAEEEGRGLEEIAERALFIGDSPNDEPMFEGFSLSVGVANLRRFLNDVEHLPRYITSQESASGFREAVSVILGKRNRSARPDAPGRSG